MVIAVGAALVIIVVLVLIVFNIKKPPVGAEEFSLRVWGVDDKSVFDDVVKNYKSVRSGAKVEYTQFDAAT